MASRGVPRARAPHEGLHLQADTVAGARLRGLRPPPRIADAAQRFQRVVCYRRREDSDEINSDVLSTCRARRAELAAVRRPLAAAGDDRAGLRDTTPAVRRPLTLFAASLCLAAVVSAASPAARLQPADPAPARAVIDRSCVTCHNQRTRTGGLTLDTLDLARVDAQPAVWEAVVRKVRDQNHAAAGDAAAR